MDPVWSVGRLLRVARLVAFTLGAVAACSGGGGEPTGAGGSGGTVDLVAVNPRSAPLGVGSTLQLTATAYDAGGAEVAGRQVFWASADSTVATVSSAGLVTARKLGTAEIQGVVDGKRASSIITVTARGVATVAVTPGTASVAAGATTQLQATVKDDQGTTLTDRFVLWTSSDDNVARVTSTGLVSGVVPGTATITASSDGKTGTAAVTVTGTVAPPGGGGGTDPTPAVVSRVVVQPSPAEVEFKGELQLTATAFDAANNVITGRTVTWSSSNASAVSVDNSGKVKGEKNNEQSTVSATVDGKTGSTTVKVVPKPARSVSFTTAPTSLVVGGAAQFAASALDGSGQVLDDRTLTFSSNADGVLTVTSTGTATAKSAGTAIVTAQVSGEAVRGTVAVQVAAPATPPPVAVASVGLSGNALTMQVGATQTLTATPRDASGTTLVGRAVTWTTSNGAVAAVNGGVVTAVAPGAATITATSEGKTATAAVTVTAVPVSTLAVAPTTAALTVGGTQQLTATARDANGTTLSGRTVSWTSSAPLTASVSATGLVTALLPGSATVTATSEGKTATAAITVAAPVATVATVTVTPSPASVVFKDSVQLTAVARDAGGTVITGRTVTWTSSNVANVAVSAAGRARGEKQNSSATVTATIDGKTGTTVVNVTSRPVGSVTVTGGGGSIQAGGTQQLTATVRDDQGTVLTDRTVAWTTSSGAVATVSGTGLVTGVAAGTATITATSEGRSGTAGVTVVPVPVATVALAPTTVSLQIAGSQQLTPTLKDAGGATLTGRAIAWTSSAPLTATVSATGLVSALLPGSATVTATSEGKTATAAVTVTALPSPTSTVSRVLTAPASVTMPEGAQQQLTATAYDAADHTVDGVSCAWASNAPPHATVDASGRVTGVKANGKGPPIPNNTLLVTATCGDKSGSSTVVVE